MSGWTVWASPAAVDGAMAIVLVVMLSWSVCVAMLVRGAHWASDVVAGYAIGVAALVTVTAVSARPRPGGGEFRRRRPSPV